MSVNSEFKNGVRLEVGVWYDPKTDSIQINTEFDGFKHITVNNKDLQRLAKEGDSVASKNKHEKLWDFLQHVLDLHDKPNSKK